MSLYGLEKLLDKKIIEKGASLASFTTFRIGGRALAVLKPRSKRELIKCVLACQKCGLKYKVIGNGSNILASVHLKDVVIITTTAISYRPALHKTTIKVGAGQNINSLIVELAKRGLSGLEKLYGIPATVGGMVVTNAGAFGVQMSDLIESVEVLDQGKILLLDKSDIQFSYHHSSLISSGQVVLSVEMNLTRLAPSTIFSIIREVVQKRQEKQPKGYSAGSMFKAAKDGRAAGLLIDMAGLKGATEGRAKISEKHANFFINTGGATFYEVKRLIKRAQGAVKEKFGVDLELEIEIIGEDNADNGRLPHPYQV